MTFKPEQLKSLKSISMTHDEYVSVRRMLELQSSSSVPQRSSIQSSFFHQLLFMRPVQGIAFGLIILLSSGASLSYASTDALPGDTLYNFKVAITEEIPTITMTNEERAHYEVARAAKRLDETVTLALEGKLNPEIEQQISENIKKHTHRAKKTAQKIQTEQTQAPLAIATQIEHELSARTEILNEIKDLDTGDQPALDSIILATETTVAETILEKEEHIITLTEQTNDAVSLDQLQTKKQDLIETIALLKKQTSLPITQIIDQDLTTLDQALSTLDTTEIISNNEPIEPTTPTIISEENPESKILEQEISTSTLSLQNPELVTIAQKNILTAENYLLLADELIAKENFVDAFITLQKASDILAEIMARISVQETFSQQVQDILLNETTLPVMNPTVDELPNPVIPSELPHVSELIPPTTIELPKEIIDSEKNTKESSTLRLPKE